MVSRAQPRTDSAIPQVAFTPIVELTTDDVVALSMVTSASDTGECVSLCELTRLGVLDQALGLRQRAAKNRIALHANAEDVRRTALAQGLTDWLERWGLMANEVEIRVAPSGRLDVESARRLDHLHTLGFHLVLERFGEAAASLEWLRDVAFDVVELAPSYAENLARSPRDKIMFTTLVDMAHRLGAAVDASGLSTAADVQFALASGIERGQGRYWSV